MFFESGQALVLVNYKITPLKQQLFSMIDKVL